MIVGDGLEKINNLISTDLSVGVIGSGSADPSYSDTDVAGLVTSVSLTDETISEQTFTCKTTIDSTTANGVTITNHGLKFSDGTLLDRNKHPNLAKTSAENLVYFNKLVLERGT